MLLMDDQAMIVMKAVKGLVPPGMIVISVCVRVWWVCVVCGCVCVCGIVDGHVENSKMVENGSDGDNNHSNRIS